MRSCVTECKCFIDKMQVVILSKLEILNRTELSSLGKRGALL